MSKSIFLFTSCRVWTSALDNKWVKEEQIIQSHYIDEIAQYVKWFQTKNELEKEELECFRSKVSYTNYNKYRKAFNNADIIFIEISSTKISKIGNLYYNLLANKTSENKTIDYLKYSLGDLVSLLKHKKIVLFTHVNTYTERNMGFIPNRTTIQLLCKYASKKYNLPIIDPTKFLCKYGEDKCLIYKDNGDKDVNHFTPFMFNLITDEIIEIVQKLYSLKLNKIQ
jgi:hypothetical protein